MESCIKLYDHITKTHIKLLNGKKGWDRYISRTKRRWTMTHRNLSLNDALTIKDEVILNNHKNLLNLISKK
jgi:hypothetical protein